MTMLNSALCPALLTLQPSIPPLKPYLKIAKDILTVGQFGYSEILFVQGVLFYQNNYATASVSRSHTTEKRWFV